MFSPYLSCLQNGMSMEQVALALLMRNDVKPTLSAHGSLEDWGVTGGGGGAVHTSPHAWHVTGQVDLIV